MSSVIKKVIVLKGNCSDTVIVDKRLSNKLKYEIGAKWTYERESSTINKVDYYTIVVTDTMTIDTMSCYVLNDIDTICTSGNRVFTKVVNSDLFQLYYDFDADSVYMTQCYNQDNDILDEHDIFIDSITTETIADGQLVNVRYLRDRDNSHNVKVYEGIGSAYGYPFPDINSCNDFSSNRSTDLTILRCFDNSSGSYRFVDYDCDSTWMAVGKKEIAYKPYVLFPNPTNGIVYIEEAPRNLNYVVTDLQGRLVLQGSYSSKGIRITEQGVFFIKLSTDEFSWIEKVVRF